MISQMETSAFLFFSRNKNMVFNRRNDIMTDMELKDHLKDIETQRFIANLKLDMEKMKVLNRMVARGMELNDDDLQFFMNHLEKAH